MGPRLGGVQSPWVRDMFQLNQPLPKKAVEERMAHGIVSFQFSFHCTRLLQRDANALNVYQIAWFSECVTPAYLQCRGGQLGPLSRLSAYLSICPSVPDLSNPDEPTKPTYQPPVTVPPRRPESWHPL